MEMSIHDFGDFHEWDTDAKKYFLIDTIPNVCIDDDTAPGHIDVLFYSFIGATCVEFPPEVRQIFDKLFTAAEDGNYDVALKLHAKQKELDVYMAELGYNHREAGD